MANAQITLVAVENPSVSDGSSRAFDLTITVPADRNFAAAEIIGTSANGDFRNQDGVFNFAFVFNNVDSWMTAPRFHPTNNGVPAATLIGAPTNSFTNTDINWAWADDTNQAVADLDGVIARIMLANGGEGTLNVQVAGTLVGGGSWSEAFTLVIGNEPPSPVLEAIERPEISNGVSRAFDLVISGLAADQSFVGAEITGTSLTAGFRNPNTDFDIPIGSNNTDSFMTAPRFIPNTPDPATPLILAPTNTLTDTAISWAWTDIPDQAVSGAGGVIARIMVANGRGGTLNVMVAGRFDGGGAWQEAYDLNLGVDDPNIPAVALVPETTCGVTGEELIVRVNLDQTNGREILGGQFFLQYDTTAFTFVSARPGGSGIPSNPFDAEIFESVDTVAGTIDYAVGVNPGNSGTTQPATMAILTFTLNADMLTATNAVHFRTHTPPTRLTARIPGGGTEPLDPLLTSLEFLQFDQLEPEIATPPDISVFADAGTCSAVFTAEEIGTPTVVDNCTAAQDIALTFMRSDGKPNLTDPFDSADSPVEIIWTATDQSGNSTSGDQLVFVEAFNVVSIDLQLQPFFDDPDPATSGNTVQRCMHLDFTDCAGLSESITDVLTISVDSPGDPMINGRTPAPVTILVPCGNYTCVTARDPLHSLPRRLLRDDGVVGFRITNLTYEVNFAGPTRWLTQGNLVDVAGDNVIDILDFGVLADQFRVNYGSRNTNCQTPAPHADIDGDAIAGIEDYTFIANNFLVAGDADCCSGLGGGPGRRSVSLEELEALGLGHLRSADLNRDGVIDVEDVNQLLEDEERRLRSLEDDGEADADGAKGWNRRVP